MVADGAAQYRVTGFDCVQYVANGRYGFSIEAELAVHAGEVGQMIWKDNADHGKVWASTDKTAGRSRTMAVHESPLSAEA